MWNISYGSDYIWAQAYHYSKNINVNLSNGYVIMGDEYTRKILYISLSITEEWRFIYNHKNACHKKSL